MESAERARSDALRNRWVAADYARLIGLRTVPGSLYVLGFALIGPRLGHPLPVFLQPVPAAVSISAMVVAVLATAEIEVRYRRTYGSVSGIPPPRRFRWMFVALFLAATALLLRQGWRLPSPYWSLGALMIFWSLPFGGGGIRRVRWHFVAAGLTIGAVAALDIRAALPLVALLAVVFGVADHLIFVRGFQKASAEPAGV